MIAPAAARSGDAVAISLSGLCLIHCLAFPLLVGTLPLFGVLAAAEWVHWGFVGLAAPVSIWALARPALYTLPKVAVVLAVVGFIFLISGAIGYPDEALETPLTVAGGLALAAAHLINWRRRPQGSSCAAPAGTTSLS